MAGTVLVKDLLWRASVLLQDDTPQFDRWTERELVDWLNDAQAAIAKYLPALVSRNDVVKLVAGTRQSIEQMLPANVKPGDGSTPAVDVRGTLLLDVIRNMGVNGLVPGRACRRSDRAVLDASSPDWHLVKGTVVSTWMYDPRTPKVFYVAPALAAATWVEIALNAQPVKIPQGGAPGAEIYLKGGSSTTTISVGDECDEDLLNYVVARGNMKDAEYADGNKAAQFAALFLGSLNARAASLTGNNPNLKALPFAEQPLARASA